MPTVDIHVRDARPADATQLAVIHSAAWRGAYLGIIPTPELERMIARRGSVWWLEAVRRGRHLAVLDFAGEIAGYVNFGAGRLRGLGQGEIYELYLRPEYQGVGLGRRLFDTTRSRLKRRRLAGLVVWSLTQNERACGFYRAMGGEPRARCSERLGGASLEKTAFVWP
jgi:ribosomal protein S18 acetylase RimI-like enzyme